jgi:hypothetical protein
MGKAQSRALKVWLGRDRPSAYEQPKDRRLVAVELLLELSPLLRFQ